MSGTGVLAQVGSRLRALAGRRTRVVEAPGYVDDGTLAVLGGSDDPAASDTAVLQALAAHGVDVTAPLLVRHRLWLPGPDALEALRQVVVQDGYAVVLDPTGPQGEGRLEVRVSRTEVPSGVGIARERTRMAGLVQRLGGDVLGWDLSGR